MYSAILVLCDLGFGGWGGVVVVKVIEESSEVLSGPAYDAVGSGGSAEVVAETEAEA